MALTLTRAVSMKFQVVGKQLREVSQSWFPSLWGRSSRARAAEAETPPHAYTHLHKSGEMNHMGRYQCDACATEMRLSLLVSPDESAQTPRYRWECPGCGSVDETSFRICRCGRQTVLEKHAASARELPVSLNAGGCTECERCVLCGGILAIGNLKWFYGRWTHLYPDMETDRRTAQQYTVTRERSKFYGFHCHFSCFEADKKAIEGVLDQRTPAWYKQGLAEQRRAEAKRLRQEGRCQVCRGRLGLWNLILDRDRHPQCR